VSDTGPGLDDADLARAFERFYLHDRYRSDPERATGSGLGLAIVAQLVAAMGGTATVSSSPGEGACFSISLPAAPAPPERDLCAR
jgi:two-component system OmpR family sensor kinase